MRSIKFGERVLLAGRTRKGKSTLARFLTLGCQPCRTIICDPKGSEAMDIGVRPVRSAEELSEHLRDPVVRWIPEAEKDILEDGFWAIWQLPGPYLVVVDEASLVSSAGWCPRGLRAIVTQGGEHRKMLIACTQRLAECAVVIRSQAEHTIVMVPTPIRRDLEAIEGHIGKPADEIKASLDGLRARYGDYAHIWHVEGEDELRECAPLPAGAIRPWPRTAPACPNQTAADSGEQVSTPTEPDAPV